MEGDTQALARILDAEEGLIDRQDEFVSCRLLP